MSVLVPAEQHRRRQNATAVEQAHRHLDTDPELAVACYLAASTLGVATLRRIERLFGEAGARGVLHLVENGRAVRGVDGYRLADHAIGWVDARAGAW